MHGVVHLTPRPIEYDNERHQAAAVSCRCKVIRHHPTVVGGLTFDTGREESVVQNMRYQFKPGGVELFESGLAASTNVTINGTSSGGTYTARKVATTIGIILALPYYV